MISASVDIGTNTVLLLVAEIRDGKIIPKEEKQRIPRLGKGVNKAKNLHPDSIQRVLDILYEYRQFLEENFPGTEENVIVTATSAVRDASNREELLDRVEKETAWKIRLLSGAEEAETTYRGALSVLQDRTEKANLILDIGGGSTELAYGTGYELENAISIDMGSVRFTERFFDSDPPADKHILQAQTEVQTLLKSQKMPGKEFELIGVAGTVTSIAAIDRRLDHYNPDELNGFRLSKAAVETFIEEFSVTPSGEIERKYPVFLKGRGEVILAGILVLREVMDWCGRNSLIVSTGGIRHGVLLSR